MVYQDSNPYPLSRMYSRELYIRTCVCGDPIEQIERSNGVVDWVHVDRPDRDHGAVPNGVA